jgi:hypothetical protein
MKDRQYKGQKKKGQTMMYKTLHRKLKMITIKVITKLPNSEQSYKGKVKTHDITNQINITIYLLHYLIKLRGLY